MVRRVGTVIAVLTALASLTPGAWAQVPPADAPSEVDADPDALLVATHAVDEARARLAAGEQLLARAASASGAATARVARAEEALVAPVIDRREARRRVALAVEAVDGAERVVAERIAALAEERDRLDLQAHRAYKFGSGMQGAMALEVIRHASSPNELSRNLHDLQAIVGYQRGEVVDASEMLARAVQALEETRTLRDRAVVRDATLDREVVAAEEHLTSLRRRADEAEARWIEVARRVLRLEAALGDASAGLGALRVAEAVAAGAAAPPAASGPVADTGPAAEATPSEEEVTDEPTLEDRQRFLRNRSAALSRARALDPELRRTRDDLTCPVDDATFSDDWHYPRSHERRHEGTDVFAPRGAPVRAVADAVITEVDRVDAFDGDHDLGGLTVSYATGPAERWYVAHLDEVRADLEPGMAILAGEVVGWVGDSGNARGTPPHVHLGWYVEDTAVNPYASLAVACGGA